jgi:hypothetical protein
MALAIAFRGLDGQFLPDRASSKTTSYLAPGFGRESSFFPFLSRCNALGFALSDQAKNRSSHPSHRNGLTKIMARINFSRTPLRRDSWIR